MSIVFLVLALNVAKLPESSTMEFSQTSSGWGGSGTEEFTITQKDRSVIITYGKLGDSWRLRRGRDSTRTHLVNRIPVDVYQDFWDTLTAYRFFDMDSEYSNRTRAEDAYRYGSVAVEYTSRAGVVSKRVSFRGVWYLPDPFQRIYDAVTRMSMWATASVEQVRAGKIAFALPRWTPRMLKYIRESGNAPEMTRYILALVDSTTSHGSSDWPWNAKSALQGFAKSSVGALDAALSHPNPQVRLLALTVVIDALGNRAIPRAREVLRDTFGEVRYKAAVFLAKRGSTDAMPVLYESLHDSTFTQPVSAWILLHLGTAKALDTVFAWTKHASCQDIDQLLGWPGLGDLTDERVSPLLRRLFASESLDPKAILSDIGKRPSDTVMFDTVSAFVVDDSGPFSTREFTVSALLRLAKYKNALPVMRAAFKKWPGDGYLMSGLGALHDSACFDTFVHYAEKGSAWQKDAAVSALAHFNSDLGRELKLRVLSSESASVYAVRAFIIQPDPRAYDRLVALLQDENSTPAMTCWICEALGALGDRRAIPYVEKAYKESAEWGRTHCIGPALESLRRKAKH